MKNIFLLRHANAENSIGSDFERNLTEKGVLKCQDVSNYLKKYIQNIDLIICSPSLRTRQTIKNILSNLNITKSIQYEDELYETSLNSLLQRISTISSKNKNILIISHNPTISEVGRFLAKDSVSSPYSIEALQGFSPGSLALYGADINLWSELDPNNITLKRFWR